MTTAAPRVTSLLTRLRSSPRWVRAEARAWELADPLKRRIRGRGKDPVSAERRALAAEPVPAFDIDVVITWVDGTDPAWIERRLLHAGADKSAGPAAALARAAAEQARYQSVDELRFCLRAIETYAPWVNRVFLVTDRQEPGWLRPGSLTVVDHRDILEPSALPTFNSHAIESAMYRIDGLAEHFVYFNDDVFLLSHAPKQLFFAADGQLRVFLSARDIPPGSPLEEDSGAIAAAKNARDLLAKDFSEPVTRLIAHTPFGQRRSIHRELWERYPETLRATEHSAYRSLTNVPPAQLHQWFAMLTGRAAPKTINWRYLELARRGELSRVPVEVARRDTDTICLNLASDPALAWHELHDLLQRSLAERFPVPSRFEL